MNFNTLIWALEELANKQEQLRLWTGQVQGQVGSFEESVSGVFDDSGLARLIDSGDPQGLLSREAMTQAILLRRVTRRVQLSVAPFELVESLEMNLVRTHANELLMLLKQSLPGSTSPATRS